MCHYDLFYSGEGINYVWEWYNAELQVKDRKWYFTGSYGSHNGDPHDGNASGKMLSWENLL